MLAKFDSGHQRTSGDAGSGKQAVAPDLDRENHVRIGHAHFGGALALLLGIEHQAALYLPADTPQRRRSQHALGRAARAHININPAVFRIDSVDDAGHVAVTDQTDRGNEVRMPRPIPRPGP